jgi:hypothetical protein
MFGQQPVEELKAIAVSAGVLNEEFEALGAYEILKCALATNITCSAVCSLFFFEHGKLQVLWGHQVYSWPTENYI